MADIGSHEYEGHESPIVDPSRGFSAYGAVPVDHATEPTEPQPAAATDESRAQVDSVLQSDV
jgi:hypothetical protein